MLPYGPKHFGPWHRLTLPVRARRNVGIDGDGMRVRFAVHPHLSGVATIVPAEIRDTSDLVRSISEVGQVSVPSQILDALQIEYKDDLYIVDQSGEQHLLLCRADALFDLMQWEQRGLRLVDLDLPTGPAPRFESVDYDQAESMTGA